MIQPNSLQHFLSRPLQVAFLHSQSRYCLDFAFLNPLFRLRLALRSFVPVPETKFKHQYQRISFFVFARAPS